MSFARGELVQTGSDKTSSDGLDYKPHETPSKKGFISFEKFAVQHEERIKQIERENALWNSELCKGDGSPGANETTSS